ncbi:MAG: hypothetical protein ACREON_04220 [Gemmatimonadaceae bacterium]
MRRPYHLVLATVCTVALAACSDAPQPLPSAPVRPELSVSPHSGGGGGACSHALAEQIQESLEDLFSGSRLATAKSLFNGVKQACQHNKPLALERALALIKVALDTHVAGYLLDPNGAYPPTTEEALAALIDQLFVYVAQPAPAVDLSAFGDDGGIKVIGAGGGALKNRSLSAAIQVPGYSTTFSHLYVIAPASPACLQTNLEQSGPCFDMSVHPHVARFDPPLTIVVCQTDGLPANSGLGHLVEASQTRVAPPTANPFADLCLADHTASARPMPRGFLAFTRFALERAGSRVLSVLSPRTLYAAHGSLAGLSTSLSPYRRVGLRTLEATFSDDAPGHPPSQPEVGSLTFSVKHPGSILVQRALGTLTNKPVVLNEKGGNCAHCGGLELAINLFSANGRPATIGSYRVRWLSLQDKSTVKDAPFVIRDASGRELARLSYVTRKGKRLLFYNGREVGSWTRGIHQEFEVTVNLDQRKTSLRINDYLVVPTASFVSSHASSLARIAAEFFGNDAGVTGWDDITVTRLPDL